MDANDLECSLCHQPIIVGEYSMELRYGVWTIDAVSNSVSLNEDCDPEYVCSSCRDALCNTLGAMRC